MNLIVGILLIIIFMGTASATEYYIKDGDSLAIASAKLNPGDILYVNAGTYTEEIKLYQSGTKEESITIIGRDAIIKRSNIYTRAFNVYGNYWDISGFEITHSWHPVYINKNAHDIILSNLDCHNNGYSLVADDGTYNITIDNCQFYSPYSRSTNYIGLRGENDQISHHISITNCSFDDCGHNAINMYDRRSDQDYYGLYDVLIENCEFNNGKQIAIATNYFAVDRFIVRNCIFDHCARGIQCSMRNTLIENCIVIDHGNHFIYGQYDTKNINITIRDIIAHSGNWGNADWCINLKTGEDIKIYNITTTGYWYGVSRPTPIDDPRPKPTPEPTPTEIPTPTPTEIPIYPRYDVNEDGIVDIHDLDLVAKHYGEITA